MTTATEIESKLADIRKKRDEVLEKLSSLYAKQTGRRADSRVFAILDGEDDADPNEPFIRHEIDVAEQDAADYRRAVELLEKKLEEARISEARDKAKAAVPAHKAARLALLKSLVAVSKAIELEQSLRDAAVYPGHGTFGLLPAAAPLNAGYFARRDYHSGISQYLREAVASGLLTGEEDFLASFAWDSPFKKV